MTITLLEDPFLGLPLYLTIKPVALDSPVEWFWKGLFPACIEKQSLLRLIL